MSRTTIDIVVPGDTSTLFLRMLNQTFEAMTFVSASFVGSAVDKRVVKATIRLQIANYYLEITFEYTNPLFAING